MGKISSLPDAERLAIIGYLAQEGVVKEITAEVPLRQSNEFQDKYGIKPYIINSDKKYGYQLRIYLSDPEDAPQILKDALDSKYQRLNDSKFVTELVDKYGFTFFSKQNSRVIYEYAKKLAPQEYDSFLNGYNTNNDFITELSKVVQNDNLPVPNIVSVSAPSTKDISKKHAGKKGKIIDSNSSLSDDQLLSLGWSGEEYLYKYLLTGKAEAFKPFSIDAKKVEDVIWFNQGHYSDENWVDGSIGQGGDILIKTSDIEYLVEVKSSKRRSPIFGMTSLEMQKMMEKRNQYYLAKIDYLENLVIGQAPTLRVFNDPYARFFNPASMQKAVFFCE